MEVKKVPESIQMVDLKGQYKKIKKEVDTAIRTCVDATMFIGGPQVASFQKNLEKYLSVKHVIPCANGTDALQIALMALGLQPGDEVIVPAFTYVATAEVIALLQLAPIMVDIDPKTFNITAEIVENAITPRTKAIVPVHLFGQSCDMEGIMADDLPTGHVPCGFRLVRTAAAPARPATCAAPANRAPVTCAPATPAPAGVGHRSVPRTPSFLVRALPRGWGRGSRPVVAPWTSLITFLQKLHEMVVTGAKAA